MMSSATAYDELAKITTNTKWKTAIIRALSYYDLERWMKIHGFRTDTPSSTIHRWLKIWLSIGYIFAFRDENQNQYFIWLKVPVEAARSANQQASREGLNMMYNPYTGDIISSMLDGVIEQ